MNLIFWVVQDTIFHSNLGIKAAFDQGKNNWFILVLFCTNLLKLKKKIPLNRCLFFSQGVLFQVEVSLHCVA